MNPSDKIQSRLTIGFVAASLLFLLVMLIIPRLVNLEMVKRTILSRLSTSMAGDLVYHQLELRWFPQPSIALHDASLTRPNHQIYSIAALKIYPKIFPLLGGRVQFKKIEIVQPRFQIELHPEVGLEPVECDIQATLRNLSERLLGLLADPVLTDSGLDYLIRDGQMDILTSEPIKPNFRKINAYLRYSNDQLRLKLSCESNIGKDIHLSGWLRR